MEYRSLGRTGVMISPVGLGSDNFGDATPAKDAENIINRSLEAGINLIDTYFNISAKYTAPFIGTAIGFSIAPRTISLV